MGEGFSKTDTMRLQMTGPAPQFVREVPTPLPGTATYDVVMCGGTLGIFLACALQLQGLRYMLLPEPSMA